MTINKTGLEARQAEINGLGHRVLTRSLLLIGVLFIAIAVLGAKTLVSAFSMI